MGRRRQFSDLVQAFKAGRRGKRRLSRGGNWSFITALKRICKSRGVEAETSEVDADWLKVRRELTDDVAFVTVRRNQDPWWKSLPTLCLVSKVDVRKITRCGSNETAWQVQEPEHRVVEAREASARVDMPEEANRRRGSWSWSLAEVRRGEKRDAGAQAAEDWWIKYANHMTRLT
jgi:hypothetical protein